MLKYRNVLHENFLCLGQRYWKKHGCRLNLYKYRLQHCVLNEYLPTKRSGPRQNTTLMRFVTDCLLVGLVKFIEGLA